MSITVDYSVKLQCRESSGRFGPPALRCRHVGAPCHSTAHTRSICPDTHTSISSDAPYQILPPTSCIGLCNRRAALTLAVAACFLTPDMVEAGVDQRLQQAFQDAMSMQGDFEVCDWAGGALCISHHMLQGAAVSPSETCTTGKLFCGQRVQHVVVSLRLTSYCALYIGCTRGCIHQGHRPGECLWCRAWSAPGQKPYSSHLTMQLHGAIEVQQGFRLVNGRQHIQT